MGFKTFKAGIVLKNEKELTKDLKAEEFLPKDTLVFPMLMHKGIKMTPIVEVGEYVLRGQLIGAFKEENFPMNEDADDKKEIKDAKDIHKEYPNGTANIHSSVSGKVVDIKEYTTSEHEIVLAVYIENDHMYKEIEYQREEDYTVLTRETILQKIREAGVVGMSGSGIPTIDKITRETSNKIDYVIVNGIECEPYLTCDYRMLMEEKDKITKSLDILLHLFEHAEGILAFSSENTECAQKYMIEQPDKGNEENKEPSMESQQNPTVKKIRVEILESKYPQGSERHLIHTLTGRKFSSSQFGTNVGAIVLNVHTIMAIYEAVILGKPVMNRMITVSGNAVENPRNFYVCIGTLVQDILDELQINKEDSISIIGGPMMGTLSDLEDNTPITKITSGITILREKKKERQTECIRCARCVEACPQSLVPMKIWYYARKNKADFYMKWNGMECISCGSCSYVCPAKIDLTYEITRMKNSLLDISAQSTQKEDGIPEIIKKEEVK